MTGCPGATYGKPVRQGVNHLKPQRSLQSVAEERVGKRCGNLRVLNSYWINQDGVYKYYEVILVDPNHKAVRLNTTCETCRCAESICLADPPGSQNQLDREGCPQAPRISWSHQHRQEGEFSATCVLRITHLDMFFTEPRPRQGYPLQPHTRLVDLEEAQHAVPPPLPVICRCRPFHVFSCSTLLPLYAMFITFTIVWKYAALPARP